jgi:quinol monooxygenase YgiN
MDTMSSNSGLICIIVTVEVVEDRIEDFLFAMEIDAVGSRKEVDCYRFDVLRDQEQINKFYFFEVYKDTNALDVHKGTDHYKVWTDFKESGGIISQTTAKTSTVFFGNKDT